MNLETAISIELIHTVVTFILGLICLLMGVTLFVVNIPEKETVKAYRKSIKILSFNYVLLSLFFFSIVFFDLRNCPDDVFPFPVLFISTMQGLFLPYALLALYSPDKNVKIKVIYYNILPFSLLIVLYGVFAALYGDPVCDSFPHFFSQLLQPAVLIRFLLLFFNIFQIVFFSILIHQQSVRYAKCLDQYYAETIYLKPQWAKMSFYFAVLIGLSSIVSSLFKDSTIDTLFTLLFCFFYFLFAIVYMQYKSVFSRLEPEFIKDLEQCNQVESSAFVEKSLKGEHWGIIKKEIVEQHLFLQSGVTVNDMAKMFHTNRTTFSAMLNSNEGRNFNTFINYLRIEHAKHIILTHPNKPISEIAQQCGFSEQSNFTRQFKLLCNDTPAAWARAQRIKA
jgi:AraC-like DNA-binding protein